MHTTFSSSLVIAREIHYTKRKSWPHSRSLDHHDAPQTFLHFGIVDHLSFASCCFCKDQTVLTVSALLEQFIANLIAFNDSSTSTSMTSHAVWDNKKKRDEKSWFGIYDRSCPSVKQCCLTLLEQANHAEATLETWTYTFLISPVHSKLIMLMRHFL